MTDTEREDTKTQLEELHDPSNFEFMESPSGDKIHIVGTGLSPSMLVRGGRAQGVYSHDDQKALCGLVTDFTATDKSLNDVNDVINHVCERCAKQSGYIRDKGKFEDIPL